MANPYSLLDMVWPMGLTSVLHVLILEQSLHSVGDLDRKKEEEERRKRNENGDMFACIILLF